MKKVNLGALSMIMTIIGGVVSLIGGVVSTLDARQTAQETARDAANQYLTSGTCESVSSNEEA